MVIIEDELVFSAVEMEDGGLFSLQDEIMVVDELVLGEAGDQVRLSYSLRSLP